MGWKSAWKKLTASTEELRDDELQRDASRMGACAVRSCGDRDKVKLHGTIESMTINPEAGRGRNLAVNFNDGSGSVTLVWMGRREVAGITAGTTLTVEGRISCVGTKRVMYNPRYELTRAPGAA